jgi:3-oxoacyl-[acyl-carrier-protein] synthase-3
VSALKRIGILGAGYYLPSKIVTNQDMEKLVDTSDDWIVTRTGIRERRIAASEELNSDMATAAAKKALAAAHLDPKDLELIVIATITPDMPTPAMSCIVQAKLGAYPAACFDLSAACSGFVYALTTVKALLQAGMFKNALVLGSEKLTAFTDWKDRSTCILFGDGAGAVILGETPEGGSEILSTYLSANGNEAEYLRLPGGGSKHPPSEATIKENLHTLKMQGREVFKIAVKVQSDALMEVLKRAGMDLFQIDLVIPHQANLRIMTALAERLNLPLNKLFVNIDRVGNTSAASVAIALAQAIEEGRLKKGQHAALVAFGAGTTLASAVVRL